ncbi:YhgE/Pip family protein [Agrococcus sp. ARC_14]|uniref:YhgE/Pip family protein n=1 Tax=Agrococcus sp. ARC_14 TaxID=2919927 RepID=UPI001F050654|nr:YhgE/Pip family protein [Agrococcus sp. ARC_14]MCH1882419.1 YhgE/Pip family protein [Agrococcus sp. ARC_14]
MTAVFTSTGLKKAVALTAAAATPFAIAALAAWSFGPAADGERDVPAAVVNLDEMVTTTAEDGTESTMFAGRQVVTDLVADDADGFAFRILNDEDAADALAAGEVQATVTIPADFSERVLSLQGDEPQQAGIRIVTDATSSGLATSLATEMGESVMSSFGDVVTNGFISGIYGGMGTIAEQLGAAADGADALGTGGEELGSGLGEIATGIDQLADGAGTAQDGATQVADGGGQLASGLSTAHAGIGQLAEGGAALTDGVDQYTGGVDQLAGGAAQLSDGVDQYTAGVDQFAGGVQQASSQISAGLEGAVAAGGIGELEDAIGSSSTGAAQLLAALEADPGTDPQALAAARQLAGGLDQLDQQDIAGQLAAGLGEATAGLGQLEAGAGELIAGGAGLREGASQLADGAGQASAGSPALRDGASQLAGGLGQLDGEFGASVTGAQQLADGTGELAAGLGELESGAVQLAAGTRSAQTGAVQLGEGGSELGAGLREGIAQMPQLSDGELADLSDVATNPIGFDLEEQNAVPSGEARVAAIAVPIGLWLGALALVLVLLRGARRTLASAESDGRVLSTLLIRSAWIVGLQAVLATVVVHAIGGVAAASIPATFGVALLFAGVATLLHTALVAWWGPVGAVVSIVLLALQAVAAGGLVPRAVLGEGFAAIAPVLPMTHAVDALQALAAGTGGVGGSVAMLLLFAAVGLLAAYLGVRAARRRATGERIRALDALAPAAA